MTDINFSNCSKLNDIGLSDLFINCTNLGKLNLSGLSITNNCGKKKFFFFFWFFFLFLFTKNIIINSIYFTKKIFSSIRYLNLSNCTLLSNNSIIEICKTCFKLVELNLNGNWLLNNQSIIMISRLTELSIIRVANTEVIIKKKRLFIQIINIKIKKL